MNFSEAMFYENYLTLDFHTNTVISRRVCLLVKMASKTVMRPIFLINCGHNSHDPLMMYENKTCTNIKALAYSGEWKSVLIL